MQNTQVAGGEDPIGQHQGNHDHLAEGNIDEKADLFCKPGLGIIIVVVFALIKAVRRQIVHPVQPQRHGSA